MKLFEYQAKGIFKRYGIPIPFSQVLAKASLAEHIREEIGKEVVLKAQVLTPGRANDGGVRLVDPTEDITIAASAIFGKTIDGNKVGIILVEEAVHILEEFFVKIEINSNLEKPELIASKIDLKKIPSNEIGADENSIRVPIELSLGLLDYQMRKVAVALEVGKDQWNKLFLILKGMWKIFTELDAKLVEINPLIINEHNQLIALGAGIDIDDNALFRQTQILDLRKYSGEPSVNSKASKYGISSFQFGGNIGCIVNNSALGFSIADMFLISGSQMGVLLDVGDGVGDEKFSAGLEILFRTRRIECVLIAVFGGLTHCDRVARGIIEAISNNTKWPPLVVYLNGSNSEKGKSLLIQSNLFIEESISSAVKKSIEILLAGN
jgi:succinyl-CoA synthetase beta subunit